MRTGSRLCVSLSFRTIHATTEETWHQVPSSSFGCKTCSFLWSSANKYPRRFHSISSLSSYGIAMRILTPFLMFCADTFGTPFILCSVSHQGVNWKIWVLPLSLVAQSSSVCLQCGRPGLRSLGGRSWEKRRSHSVFLLQKSLDGEQGATSLRCVSGSRLAALFFFSFDAWEEIQIIQA